MELNPGDIVTVTDSRGQQYAATFHILQNGGSGNGVLTELDLHGRSMPNLLAFGDVQCEPFSEEPVFTWAFYSYTRLNPPLRGKPLAGQPGREVLLLTRPA